MTISNGDGNGDDGGDGHKQGSNTGNGAGPSRIDGGGYGGGYGSGHRLGHGNGNGHGRGDSSWCTILGAPKALDEHPLEAHHWVLYPDKREQIIGIIALREVTLA